LWLLHHAVLILDVSLALPVPLHKKYRSGEIQIPFRFKWNSIKQRMLVMSDYCFPSRIYIMLPRRLVCITWLAQNFGARNNLVSVFHQTLTFHVKGQMVSD